MVAHALVKKSEIFWGKAVLHVAPWKQEVFSGGVGREVACCAYKKERKKIGYLWNKVIGGYKGVVACCTYKKKRNNFTMVGFNG